MTEQHAATCGCESCQQEAAGALTAAATAELDGTASERTAAAKLLSLVINDFHALVREETGLKDNAAIREVMFAVLDADTKPTEDREASDRNVELLEIAAASFKAYEQRANGETPQVYVQAWRERWAPMLPRVWGEWRERNAARTGARECLAKLTGDEAELAKIPEAEGRLVEATEKLLSQVREALGPLPTGADLEQLTPNGEMLAVAEQHAAFISRALPTMAGALRKAERARLADWQANQDGEPPWKRWEDRASFAGLLAARLWKTEVREQIERLNKVLVPSVHPLSRKLIFAARGGATFEPEKDGRGIAIIRENGRELLPAPCALVAIGNGTQEGGLVASGRDLRALVPLVTWLAVKVHERWSRNVPRFDYVPMRVGRNALLQELGVELTEAEIDEALVWLRSVKVGGFPFVAGWKEEDAEQIGAAPRSGGRPEKRRVIQVGPPLAPQGLVEVFKTAGVTMPRELRFYSPVLPSEWAPLKGDQRTMARQRDFFSLGLGAMLIDQRADYAKGGIRFDQAEWRRELAAMGIYHRTHASLADNLWAALTTAPKQGQLGGPRHPALVEKSAGRWVLGPDFEPQDRAIRRAAETTTDAKTRRKKQGA